MDKLEAAIQKTIEKNIPSGYIFDTHTLIQLLIQKYSKIYVQYSKQFPDFHLYHGYVGKVIKTMEGKLVDDLGKSISKNIKDKFSECECWKRKIKRRKI